ncbi:MAG: HD domain-containing protein, partial [Candidatus Diapherotrites archaeon]|nr:HD domain-containing protein [Candidatus Diapherotrites archaeon]
KEKKLDVCKAVKIALVHDLPEAICGDIASRAKEQDQAVSNKEKHRIEEKALDEILKELDKETGKEISGLWHDLEERKSREAKLVSELDRLEAIFQAVEYEKSGNFEVSLQEFYDYADARVKSKNLREIFEALMKEKEK